MNLILTLPFFAYLSRRFQRRWQKAACVGGFGVAMYNIVLTNTRAAILVAMLVVAACVARRLVRPRVPDLLALGLLLALLLPRVSSHVYDRVFSPASYMAGQSRSLSMRFEFWRAGLRIVGDYWFCGMGLGNERMVPKYVREMPRQIERITCHNIYLMTLMEVGVLGWLLFFGFVGVLLTWSFKAARLARDRPVEVFNRDTLRLEPLPGGQADYWLMVAIQIAMLSVMIFGVQVDVWHFPLKGWWLVAGMVAVVYPRLKRGDWESQELGLAQAGPAGPAEPAKGTA
jgi:O-antigen ligase